MKVLSPQMKQAEFTRTVWSVTPPAGTTVEELTQPEAWVHVQKALRVGDVVEAMPEDGSWFAQIIVRARTQAGPKFGVLHFVPFGDPVPKGKAAKTAAEAEGREGFVRFVPKFLSPKDKWGVLRESDNEIVARGLPTKDSAEDWISTKLDEALA